MHRYNPYHLKLVGIAFLCLNKICHKKIILTKKIEIDIIKLLKIIKEYEENGKFKKDI